MVVVVWAPQQQCNQNDFAQVSLSSWCVGVGVSVSGGGG